MQAHQNFNLERVIKELQTNDPHVIDKIRKGPTEFCSHVLRKLHENHLTSEMKKMLEELSFSCCPAIARELLLLGNRKIIEKVYPEAFVGLITISVSDKSYKDVISYLSKAFREDDLVQVLLKKLASEKFRNNFRKDYFYTSLIGPNFYNKLKQHINQDPELAAVCDEIKNALFKKLQQIYQFKNPLSDQQKDIMNIALFLTDTNAMRAQLEKLEQRLENIAVEKNAAEIIQGTVIGLKDYVEGQVYDHKKLLSNYLYQWAAINKFSGYAKLYGILETDNFFEVLRSQSIFKDVGFRGRFHNEWTHFLQWFCIGEYYNEKGNAFLSTEPATLFAWIGEMKGDIWDYTFEGNLPSKKFKPTINWGDVIQFNQFLCNEETCGKEFPVLYQLIKGRTMKETTQKNHPSHELHRFQKNN